MAAIQSGDESGSGEKNLQKRIEGGRVLNEDLLRKEFSFSWAREAAYGDAEE